MITYQVIYQEQDKSHPELKNSLDQNSYIHVQLYGDK